MQSIDIYFSISARIHSSPRPPASILKLLKYWGRGPKTWAWAISRDRAVLCTLRLNCSVLLADSINHIYVQLLYALNYYREE